MLGARPALWCGYNTTLNLAKSWPAASNIWGGASSCTGKLCASFSCNVGQMGTRILMVLAYNYFSVGKVALKIYDAVTFISFHF